MAEKIPNDYYEILEVHPKASTEVIRKAYLVLAKKYHPDTQQGFLESNNLRMKKINAAYRILSDPTLRAEYDKAYYSNVSFHAASQNEASRVKEDPGPAASMSDLTLLHNEIAQKCKEIIDEHSARIIKNDEAVMNNRSLCERLLLKYNQVILPLVIRMRVYREKDFSSFQDAMTWAAASLFAIGVGFTWANDYIKAEMLLSQALGLHPEPRMARKISDVYVHIRNNATAHSSTQTTTNSTPSGPYDSKAFKIAGTAFAVIFIIVILLTALSPDQVTKGTAPKTPIPPASSVQKPTPSPPAKPAFTPILDKPTGYDPAFNQPTLDGYCQLTIDNKRNDYPVHVKLYMMLKGDERTRFVLTAFFIQKGDSFILKNVPHGSFGIHYKNLKTGASYKTPPFDLEVRETTTERQYSVVTITLFTVPGGNLKMISIPEEEF